MTDHTSKPWGALKVPRNRVTSMTDHTATALEDVKKQAFNEGIEAAMDAILHDHNKPEDNRTWVGERPYVCEENSYHAIRALKKE